MLQPITEEQLILNLNIKVFFPFSHCIRLRFEEMGLCAD